MKRILPILCLGFLALTTALSAQTPSSLPSCAPSITCYNGLAVHLQPVSGPDNDLLADEFRAVVHAADLVRGATTPCPMTLNYRIRKSGQGTGVPTTVDVSFDCSELGIQLVEVWAGDGAPENWTYTETYVLVQDNLNYCEADPQDYSLDCGENDAIPPYVEVLNGLGVSLLPGANGNASAKVTAANLVLRKFDNCQGPVKLRIRKAGTGAGVPASSFVTFDCNELGTQLLEVWAGDTHGNWSFTESYVIIQDANNACGASVAAGCNPDLTPPNVIVYDGFAINMRPGTFSAQVGVKMFTRQRDDNCSTKLALRISKSSTGVTSPPNTVSVTFSCNELGTQAVDIWAIDDAGNYSVTQSYVIVQDNTGTCGNSPRIAIPEWKTAMPTLAVQRERQPVEAVDGMAVWPNPTTGAFSLAGYLDQADFVQVELYNTLGQQVRTLLPRQWQDAGDVQYDFEMGDLPAGLYRCALRTSTGVQSVSLIRN